MKYRALMALNDPFSGAKTSAAQWLCRQLQPDHGLTVDLETTHSDGSMVPLGLPSSQTLQTDRGMI